MSISQLSRLLPLSESELQQVLDHAATLSKAEAVEHFTNLLGDTPAVIDFISTFNSHRVEPTINPPAPSPAGAGSYSSSSRPTETDAVPKLQRGQKKKKKQPLHALPARPVTDHGLTPGAAYNKKDVQDDYVTGRSNGPSPSSGTPVPQRHPPTKSATPPPSQSQSSHLGTLVSELGLPKSKSKSTSSSRSSTPNPNTSNAKKSAGGSSSTMTKVTITGGTPMHGASTALADLDEAIRALELVTNPSHPSNSTAATAARRCDCVAARHPLQSAAPNCLACGKVICVKEGLGPCTFCGTPLLSSAEVQGMIGELKAERGRERMAVDREAHRKPAVGGTPRPFSSKPGGGDGGGGVGKADAGRAAAEARAKEHRDRLLGFQAQNARRTTVRDEATDFDAGAAGSMWANPEERARELKKQQKLLRELEWNARPDYEKRRQVVSIDLVGGKVVRKMAAVERPASPEEESDDADGGAPVLGEVDANTVGRRPGEGGAFSRNPLLGGVIKPVYDSKGKGTELEGRKGSKAKWRRVQDDLDDNEAVILDGGVYGGLERGV